MGKLSVYVLDCETVNLDPNKGDIIELSILRTSDMEQKTWFIKPTRIDGIDDGALKVNGAKREDLLWQTQEGREKYRLLTDVLPEVENFICDDGSKINDRILAGQNIKFDEAHLLKAWEIAGCKDSYPFSGYGMLIDTKCLALFFDWINGENNESYSLKNLIKKYGIEKQKLHAASDDVKMTHKVLLHFVEKVKKAQ